jgi:hypothetical protein
MFKHVEQLSIEKFVNPLKKKSVLNKEKNLVIVKK